MKQQGYIIKSRDGSYYTAIVVREVGGFRLKVSKGGIPSLEAAREQLKRLKTNGFDEAQEPIKKIGVLRRIMSFLLRIFKKETVL